MTKQRHRTPDLCQQTDWENSVKLQNDREVRTFDFLLYLKQTNQQRIILAHELVERSFRMHLHIVSLQAPQFYV